MLPIEETISIRGININYSVKRIKNRRHIKICITQKGTLIVSAPYGISHHRIIKTLKTKEDWIYSNLERYKTELEKLNPLETLFYNGYLYTVVVNFRDKTDIEVIVNHDEKLIQIFTSKTDNNHNLDILKKRLLAHAKIILPEKVKTLSDEMGILINRVYIRNQRTLWGSSTSKKNISLNWRIIMASLDIQRYLIIHELIHQFHFNHSKEYWTELEKWYPDYKNARRWFKDNHLLMSLFR